MIFGEILHANKGHCGGLTVREDCTDMESVIHDHHATNRIASNSMTAIDSDQEHARIHIL